ncbi:MAG: hypothetical protein HP000_03525 [Odoribacter sp.]|uniref:hypothetical protein n=2 Tax=Odoribacter laneus TaxID=626933 RepID=UPI001898B3B9|nr:hypothetical protein [Odoribacter laneus]MBS1445365.1 hypothetical protein [Odoribacter sp.]
MVCTHNLLHCIELRQLTLLHGMYFIRFIARKKQINVTLAYENLAIHSYTIHLSSYTIGVDSCSADAHQVCHIIA